jgi:phosphoglycolate phosphatase-like HAD superfamily hydrolase
MAEARRRGWVDRKSAVALIGDAPADIIAARENGIRSIAVHTGISSADELREHCPDFLLENLRRLRLDMLE